MKLVYAYLDVTKAIDVFILATKNRGIPSALLIPSRHILGLVRKILCS